MILYLSKTMVPVCVSNLRERGALPYKITVLIIKRERFFIIILRLRKEASIYPQGNDST
jgi:hypothetical protein